MDLTSALWMAIANDVDAMAALLLNRMLVVDVPAPTRYEKTASSFLGVLSLAAAID